VALSDARLRRAHAGHAGPDDGNLHEPLNRTARGIVPAFAASIFPTTCSGATFER
jgi:hypothetical protein